MGKNEINGFNDHNSISHSHVNTATLSFDKVDVKPTFPTQLSLASQVISLSGQVFSEDKMKIIR
jgi:hypothetical protein